MNASEIKKRLAVCSWSLRPETPGELLKHLETIGIKRVQVALDPVRENPAVWGDFAESARRAGVELVSGMFVTVGEDYTTLETIRKTGGVVPDETWDQNWRNIEAVASIAEFLGLRRVTFHAGFLPHEPADPEFHKLHERLALIADLFAARRIDLGLETGQETAATLRAFLEELNRPNVGVNFDPANMLLYDKGDPIAAVRELGPWLKQCHIKDARKTTEPGTWGQEVTVGTGEVDWKAFFEALQGTGFQGDLAIEREAGEQRVEDILSARRHLETLFPGA